MAIRWCCTNLTVGPSRCMSSLTFQTKRKYYALFGMALKSA